MQNHGTAMGNPLLPLIRNSEIFMAEFETDLSYHPVFIRVLIRYVDSVYVCFLKSQLIY